MAIPIYKVLPYFVIFPFISCMDSCMEKSLPAGWLAPAHQLLVEQVINRDVGWEISRNDGGNARSRF